MDRDQLVKASLELFDTCPRITLQWGTSVGKSRAAIEMMNRVLESKKDSRILLLVNEKAHMKNWEEQFNTWNLKDRKAVVMYCYASLKKCLDNWDMVIADEAHHLNSELRLQMLEEVKTKRFICLSATMPKELQRSLDDIYGEFLVHRISLQRSIDYGILTPPDIRIVTMVLDDLIPDQVLVDSWGKSALRKIITCDYRDRFDYRNHRDKYPNVELHIRCTQQQKYNEISLQYDYWEKRYMASRQEYAKNKWLRLGSERKKFLGECKTQAAHMLINSMSGRFICFCTNILQAEALGSKGNVIHSKISASQNQRTIDDFNSGRKNSLFAVNMLQEGMNLKNLDWGMIVQLDGYPRGWIQKMGRMMRGNQHKIIILYYKDTKDERYLKNVLEGVNNDYITYVK